MVAKKSLHRIRRRVQPILPVVGLVGWIYGLPGFITDGRWWWQSTSQVGWAIAATGLALLITAGVVMRANGLTPRLRRLRSKLRAAVT